MWYLNRCGRPAWRPRFVAGAMGAALGGWAVGAPAQAPARGDSAEAVAFLDSLRAAVGRDDRPAVAALVSYPARVWDGRRTLHVASAAALLRAYPRVVSPGLRRDVAAATADSLFTNWQGTMFAAGRVWFRRAGRAGAGPYRIVTINHPAAGH